MSIKEKIFDWYLTKQTGMDKQERAWRKWRDENINFRTDTVQQMLRSFKHIVEVHPEAFFNHEEMGQWVPVADWKQFAYPEKQLGENAVWIWARGYWGDQRWNKNEFFIGTNSDENAIYFSLRF